jgi:tetraprenyl-beta-curcumene synthase
LLFIKGSGCVTIYTKQVSNPVLIFQFVKKVFPKVKQRLRGWKNLARLAPDQVLSEQALESINRKTFHCLGGSIYALYPGVITDEVVEFIVAYQTISDYLDNLVDALDVQDERAFAQLHRAMTEALEPDAVLSDYYAYYPYRNDGGYLNRLVKTCQERIKQLPSYERVKPEILWLAEQYSSLQTTKHLALSERERKMLNWIQEHLQKYPEISAWEFAAATGSTLGIFCLYSAAFNPELCQEEINRIKQAYFPWIAGLHILLDYFIDLKEDQETSQLNFVEYYESTDKRKERLSYFVQKSLQQAQQLSYSKFHEAVIKGLLAMYLSDEKGQMDDLAETTKSLIKAGGKNVSFLYWVCLQLRKRDIL